MDLKEIKELIALMRKNDLSVFKLEQEGFKVTLKRGSDPIITVPSTMAHVAMPAGLTTTVSQAPPAAAPEPLANDKIKDITAPTVGMFYARPTPESEPYVKVGQDIQAGTVVCIIEAMKMMNEFKAEFGGTIVEVVAENGKPVQYDDVLFRVRTA